VLAQQIAAWHGRLLLARGAPGPHGRCTGAPRLPQQGTRQLASCSTGAAPPPKHLLRAHQEPVARAAAIVGAVAAGGLSLYGYSAASAPALLEAAPLPDESDVVVMTNWSATHEVKTSIFKQPDTQEELEAVIAEAHSKGQRLRVVGSALSPNGIGLGADGMVNLAALDNVVYVDKAKKQVRVQAGAKVSQVVEALRPHGLTLQNYASISEQQIGGFMQIGAHGTGAHIPPVDEQIVAFKLVTPGKGTIEVTPESDEDLFHITRVGLGAFGVVSEVTLQCVPAHQLLERTFVSDIGEVKKNHAKWLREFQHLRYMWIPMTDAIVVVASNPIRWWQKLARGLSFYASNKTPEEVRTQRLQELLMSKMQKQGAGPVSVTPGGSPIAELSFAQLRDELLALAPLDRDFVKSVNAAEADFWRRSQGYRVEFSDKVLSFECGGQQWVSEIAFPVGEVPKENNESLNSEMPDIRFMEEVLSMIEEKEIAAPAPIEQRWTCSSRSGMSPASLRDSRGQVVSICRDSHSTSTDSPKDFVHTWVGIIMYLPTDDPVQRDKITAAFKQYEHSCRQRLWGKYNASQHWAKIELPPNVISRAEVLRKLHTRMPVDAFNAKRRELDPKNIMANDAMNAIFGVP